jgi:hypothetical protein
MTTAEKQLIDAIMADATDERRLLELALHDTVEAFVRYAVRGRSLRSAIANLEGWRQTFEKAGRWRS